VALTQASTVSTRWLVPFVRVAQSRASHVEALASGGLGGTHFADPNMRIGHRESMAMIREAVERLHEPRLGIKAALSWVPGDYETFEFASRTAPTLRDAIRYSARNIGLLHGGQELRLQEDDQLAVWELRHADDLDFLPAANDYILTMAMLYSRTYASKQSTIRAVHFEHREPTDLVEYQRLFQGAQIRMGARHNALVFDRSQLDAPMALAHPGLHMAFDYRAQALTENLRRDERLSDRLRRELALQLDQRMGITANRLAMSVATLRRRLEHENIRYSDLLDQVRRERAESYLLDSSIDIKGVAALLGFAHVTAFYKAFGRWNPGSTPRALRDSRARNFPARV
jgi:AraC-like DNA-binding protein